MIRAQALVLTVRLIGTEDEALAYTGTHPFIDTDNWLDPYVAYGRDKGLIIGITDNEFRPNQEITFKQFTAFMLRTLGYSDANGDFDYELSIEKAIEIRMYTEDFANELLSSEAFLRDDAVVIMVNVLRTKCKGSDEILLYTLAELGIFTQEEAESFLEAVNRIDERGF